MVFTSEYKTLIILYLSAINIIAFTVYGIDKLKAIKYKWRIPESTLIILAAIGGSVGAFIGMKAFHHKTKHPKFFIGIPVIFLLQISLVIFISIR